MTQHPSSLIFRLSLSAASAVLLVLSFPNFNFEFLAWFALVPIFFAVQGERPFKAFLFCYLTGALFFFGTIYWLIHVTFPGMIVVVLYLALYFGIFGMAVSYSLQHKSFSLLFFIPSLWVSLEFLRSYLFTGFGWVLLAHSQSFSLPVIQIADITGAYGVTFLIVMVNTAIFFTIRDFRKKNHSLAYLAVAIVIVYLALAYGSYRLKNIFIGEETKVSVVQGNVPQDHKWDARFREEIIAKYEALTKAAAKEEPDLVIWPESSVPGFLESERDLFDRVKFLATELKIPVLIGTPSDGGKIKGAYYNSAILFDAEGKVTGRYDKIHLVPFGEYLPFRHTLSFVENFAPSPIGDFNPGDEYTVFRFFMEKAVKDMKLSWKLVKKVSFSTLICFEDIFPDMARQFVKKGAAFLVNITNDAWFGKTCAPYQHAQNSIFRAVENRVNVVRAANTGVSCFIDQKGRITGMVESDGKETFVDGYKTGTMVLTRTRTFYTAFGDVFAAMCVVFTFVFMLFNRRRRWV